MENEKLREFLKDVRIVREINGEEYTFRLSSGHGINIEKRGNVIDHINVGDFKNDFATAEEIIDGIKQYIGGEK